MKARAVTAVSQQTAGTSRDAEAKTARGVRGQEQTIALEDADESWLAIYVPHAPECEAEAMAIGILTTDGSGLTRWTAEATVVLAPSTDDLRKGLNGSHSGIAYVARGRAQADPAIVALVEDRRKRLRIAREKRAKEQLRTSEQRDVALGQPRLEFGRAADNDNAPSATSARGDEHGDLRRRSAPERARRKGRREE
jgi:hypothetical protein